MCIHGGADPPVRAGRPRPAAGTTVHLAGCEQADEGVGRGPGGPPHHQRRFAALFLSWLRYPENVGFDQAEFEVRCEWGLRGLRELGAASDVIVIVDVLSFTTAIDVATARRGVIFPYPLKGESAAGYARSHNANLASGDRGTGFSLSPRSLGSLPGGYRLVLPSPNGAALSFAVDHAIVLAACLRNATAVAHAAARLGSSIAVIPAGEMWPTGELRPSLEDLVGAGAVIDALSGRRSPEATLAAAAFHHFREGLLPALRESGSGKELMERGFGQDIEIAAELNVSANVPRLVKRAFVGMD